MFASSSSSLRRYLLKPSPSFITQIPNFHRLLHQSPLLLHPNTSTDFQQLIRNQTNLSTTLANHLFTNKFPNSNVVFSPFTIHFILTLIAFGSRGRTLDQLLTFLKTNSTQKLESLYSQLQTSIIPDDSFPDDGSEFPYKNEISVSKLQSIKPPSNQPADKVYKAALQVGYETVGSWFVKFDYSEIKEAEFNLLDGERIKVSYITNKELHYAREYDGFKVLRCPYPQQGKTKFSLYVFLPNEKDGIQSLIEKISSTFDFFETHNPDQKVEMGKFFIPKFKILFGFEASSILKELGLVLPYNDQDGLTDIVDWDNGQNIYISSMPQEISVEVKEEDTKRARVSEFVEDECSPMIKPKMDFVADHPFLFAIRKDVTRVVLFMGQVIDPSVG